MLKYSSEEYSSNVKKLCEKVTVALAYEYNIENWKCTIIIIIIIFISDSADISRVQLSI